MCAYAHGRVFWLMGWWWAKVRQLVDGDSAAPELVQSGYDVVFRVPEVETGVVFRAVWSSGAQHPWQHVARCSATLRQWCRDA